METQRNIEKKAIKSKRRMLAQEHELSFVQGSDVEVVVKDVWSKFFFKNNLMCFQILLQIDSGEIVLYQELKDYSEYKNTLKELQAARTKNAVINIPKKIISSGLAIPKVA